MTSFSHAVAATVVAGEQTKTEVRPLVNYLVGLAEWQLRINRS